MTYKMIKIYKYMGKDIKKEYVKRFSSPSAMKTSFFISPIEKGIKIKSQVFELWVNNIPEITSLVNVIYKNSKELVNCKSKLTSNQFDEFMQYLLIEEMLATNEYEGVKSTHQELKDALDSLQDESSSHRFKGLSKLYQRISRQKLRKFYTPEELREVYDELVAPEIAESDKIEAHSLFRKEKVMIGDSFSTVHAGEEPEKIYPQLQQMLDFLNEPEPNFSSLIKAVLSHYMFEYIHPFYDGNGRIGRYLLANCLGFELEEISSLLISGSAAANQKSYEKAFQTTSDKDNFAEATFFVVTMLELLAEAQQKNIFLLQERCRLAENTAEIIEHEAISPFEKELFWLYFDHKIFGNEVTHMTRKEIESHFHHEHWSEYKQRKAEASLESKGFILKLGERPVTYQLDPEFVESLQES